ncbi:hypothetical protein GLOTRDRAFT_55822 [Gloeophyllum trabeum ATCC 11539]|uniref:Uncharacterized protein n=1 Tax=Gloeophyllum trabeum (strain ATCC 11539 / FP-39264 / Madison 617) TaxID=670483 RepID=S7RXI9_GLOTA|nr:uncharacterized protein GLOTRDRAFT_55822 [Gloeophyllum trabeum ATCC 11539]EPQ59640.1 hypothetical protein GLOTRDRAFT_55822 [Gloeophyllum trabeum ATCC 11539]
MKALRNSLKGNKDQSISGPLPRISKPSPALQPPQKVIRATSSYKSQAPQELSFQKGDFFYIFTGADSPGAYYEAHNPVSGARGLVPKALFEELQKNSSKLHISPPPPMQNGRLSPNGPKTPGGGPKSPKPQVFYAVVMHDFTAERADELDAKAGDPISVVAQSNREWFVAKPIGRLGRPGLIPVSFVEVRDPATNQPIPDIDAIIDRGELPRVEEWKRQMLTYKANSISLGVIDDVSSRGPVPNSPFMPQYPPTPEMPAPVEKLAPPPPSNGYDAADGSQAGPSRPVSPLLLPEGVLLAADVTSFHHEMEEYWFRINAIYQPFEPPNSDVLPAGKQLVLFRSYNDFFDFQVKLLEMFPREAGREPPHKRILPFMPGPVEDVDAVVTAQRRAELDAYLHHLCDLLQTNAQYILRHRVLREFLSVKPGDVETDIEPQVEQIRAMRDVYEYMERNGDAHDQDNIDPLADDSSYEDELNHGLSRTRIQEEDEGSEGSIYEDDTRVPGQAHDRDQTYKYHNSATNGNGAQMHHGYKPSLGQDLHARSGSTSSLSIHRTQSPGDSAYHSRSNSPVYPPSQKDTYSLRNQVLSPRESESTRSSGYSQTSHMSAANSAASSATSPTSARSRSIANTPPISASNQQPAFVKIKIFDRTADDLIAIRVHPKVSYSQLIEKVQGRLGGNIAALKYRDSMNNAFVELEHDEDLREWIETADKYVLYAE